MIIKQLGKIAYENKQNIESKRFKRKRITEEIGNREKEISRLEKKIEQKIDSIENCKNKIDKEIIPRINYIKELLQTSEEQLTRLKESLNNQGLLTRLKESLNNQGFISRLFNFFLMKNTSNEINSMITTAKNNIDLLQNELKQLEDQQEALTTTIESLKNEIIDLEAQIKEKQDLNLNYTEDLKKLETEIGETETLSKSIKQPKAGSKKSFMINYGINSFKNLTEILGPLVIDEEDLKSLNSDNDSRNYFFIFRQIDPNNLQNSNLDARYCINTKTINHNASMMIIMPIQKDGIWSENIKGFDSETIILSNTFGYPEGTVCLIPKGKRKEVRELFKKDSRFKRVELIEYDGDKVGEYPRALVKMVEGNDPENWTKDILKKRFKFLKEVKENYYENKALSDMIDFLEKLKKYRFTKMSSFVENLLFFEQQMPEEYLSIEDMFEQVLNSKNGDVKQALKYLSNALSDEELVISQEGIELFDRYLTDSSSINKKTAELIDNNPAISKEYRYIFVTNINRFLKDKTSLFFGDMRLKIFLEIFAVDNKILDLRSEISHNEEKQGLRNYISRQKFETIIALKEETAEIEKDIMQAKNRRRRRKPKDIKSASKRKESVDIPLLYDNQYIDQYNKLTETINDICENSKLTATINGALRTATEIFEKTIDEEYFKKTTEISIQSGRIRLKDPASKKPINIPLKGNDISGNRYRRQGDDRIVTLVRLIHVCNRLAHSYNHIFEDNVYKLFYSEKYPDTDEKTIKNSKEFKNLSNAIEVYCTALRAMKDNERKSNSYAYLKTLRDNVARALNNGKVEKEFDENYLDFFNQILELKSRSYELKNDLIKFTTTKMKERKYSYGTKRIARIKENGNGKVEDVLIINLPNYGQVVFHIISQEILDLIDHEYESNIPLIKEGYGIDRNHQRNTVNSPILTRGISDELKNRIEKDTLLVVLEQIVNTDEPYEEKKKDIAKVLLSYGESIDNIESILKSFDNKYGNLR